MFKMDMTPDVFKDSLEDVGIRRVTRLWSNFARYGDPNSLKSSSLINVYWPPVKERELHFLDIGENLTVGVNPESIRMQFWEKIFQQHQTVSTL